MGGLEKLAYIVPREVALNGMELFEKGAGHYNRHTVAAVERITDRFPRPMFRSFDLVEHKVRQIAGAMARRGPHEQSAGPQGPAARNQPNGVTYRTSVTRKSSASVS